MSTRDEVRRELKELTKLAEEIRLRKEHAIDAPASGGEWSAFAATSEQAPSEASALAPPQPRPSRATVPPVSPSQPSVSSLDAGGVQNSPIYTRRPGLVLALGAALVCAVAGTAAVGRSVSTKPPAAGAHGPALQEAAAKPTAPAVTLESAAITPAKPALPEPVKASAVTPSPPTGGTAPSRPSQKPAIARTTGDPAAPPSSPKVSTTPRSAHAASSAEQSLDDLIRKTLAAPAR
ncbi:MAG TPA: hypothetical protein VGY54_16490 [Polyangiaceae bacterium]|jgi:hypothetical protein|nr:hypothetical protein [Polyangiaceae bacterium]